MRENIKDIHRVNATYQRDIYYMFSTYFSLRNVFSKLQREN